MRILSIVLIILLWGSCRPSFYLGEDGEYLLVVNKKVPADPQSRTLYTVKNITQARRFMSGSRVFNVYSRHVFHVGDTVEFYHLDSPKRRGIHDHMVIAGEPDQ